MERRWDTAAVLRLHHVQYVHDDIRASDHKNGIGSAFTARYHFDRCVYFERYESVLDAIAREKQIKGWTRAKKIALVKTINPKWRDLTPLPSP